ncbi:hypothetical protein PAMP_013875 [Pampus punctatissimus]
MGGGVCAGLCSADGEPHCTLNEPGRGEAAIPVWPFIHHRYGNYHSVLSEPSPHSVLSETGPPGDTDYKTLQLRLSLQHRAQLSFSPPAEKRRMMRMRHI